DDLGALVMLNHFQNKGEINLLGVVCWNTEQHAVRAIDAVNTHYGNPDIPIGLRAAAPYEVAWNHSKVIAAELEHDATPDNVPEATALYRKILSESADQDVTIVTVGPLMNIKKLLDSAPDDYSELDGTALLHQKVKEMVIMGGQYPSGENEWNFNGDMPGVTQYVLERLELPITFSGYELGVEVKTGEVFNTLPKTSPLYLGFYHFSQFAPWTKDAFNNRIHDNATYDQTAVLYAVRSGLGTYWHKVENGRCLADSTGGNQWIPSDSSNHAYLVLDVPPDSLAADIEGLMLGNF
ncbi:MAG: nucleoside hydrolase, partial [Bacteroidota bacterium]